MPRDLVHDPRHGPALGRPVAPDVPEGVLGDRLGFLLSGTSTPPETVRPEGAVAGAETPASPDRRETERPSTTGPERPATGWGRLVGMPLAIACGTVGLVARWFAPEGDRFPDLW